MSTDTVEFDRAPGRAAARLEAIIKEEDRRTARLVAAAEGLSTAFIRFRREWENHNFRTSTRQAGERIPRFDPLRRLTQLTKLLQNFGRLLREFERCEDIDHLDPEKLRARFSVWYAEEESRASYEYAERIFRAAISGQDVGALIRCGWYPPEPDVRAARDGPWLFIPRFVQLMTGDQCVDSYRRELGAGDVLRLAEAVHDNYRQMGNWSATDLHRNGMAIGTITEALQALGIEQPMPNCWKDSEQTATTKMDAVIRALRSAAASSARIKSPPMMETLVPHADGDGRSAGPPSLTAPGVKRKKGKRGALAKACALKRACPELDRDQVAKQIGCDRSLLSNDRYREVEKEAEAKLARAHAKRGIL